MLKPLLIALSLTSAFSQNAQAQKTCDPRAYGAVGDGAVLDTAAIQKAVDACAGGGRVLLQNGIFLSGTVYLKSNLHFEIASTATLKGTQDIDAYPDQNPSTDNSQLLNCRKSLIYAEGVHHLVIEGGGTIDGNGNQPKWIGPSQLHPERTRPMAIFTVQSTDVTIQNLHVKDAAMWGVVSFEDDDVHIRNLNIRSPLSGNRDGIDVVDCHRVLIENNTILSEDDSICLKSGNARGTEDVIVRENHVLQSIVANALKLGTASTGSFKNISFEDNLIDGADKAAMAVESVDGAAISNVTFRRIQFHQAGSGIFVLLGRRGSPPSVGSIQHVVFENIKGDRMKHGWGSAISGTRIAGTTYAPKDIRFTDVDITEGASSGPKPQGPPEYDGRYPDPNLWGNLPAFGYYLRHVENVVFDHCRTSVGGPDARSAIEQDDTRNVIVK